MLNIPSHKRNVNQNHVKTPPSLQLEWLSSRKQTTTKNVIKNAGGKETSFSVGGNVN
jgi:hypothetical protein